jgi:hypothetical protein
MVYLTTHEVADQLRRARDPHPCRDGRPVPGSQDRQELASASRGHLYQGLLGMDDGLRAPQLGPDARRLPRRRGGDGQLREILRIIEERFLPPNGCPHLVGSSGAGRGQAAVLARGIKRHASASSWPPSS